MATSSTSHEESAPAPASESKICGLVRPIAPQGDYTAEHWQDVHEILLSAAKRAGYTLTLVSETDVSGTILGDIVTNLYFNDVVICDVSGRNPNVMFELGMRLAFEKPVVIVADDITPFSFDISPIRHIIYPKTLRYSDILSFKEKVASALENIRDGRFDKGRGYLQQYGPIEVTRLQANKVDISEIAEKLTKLTNVVNSLRNATTHQGVLTGALETRVIGGKRVRFVPGATREVTFNVSAEHADEIGEFLMGRFGALAVVREDTPSKARQRLRLTKPSLSDGEVRAFMELMKEIDPSAVEYNPLFD